MNGLFRAYLVLIDFQQDRPLEQRNRENKAQSRFWPQDDPFYAGQDSTGDANSLARIHERKGLDR